jgi:uncharacterized protein (TIGR02145 family)
MKSNLTKFAQVAGIMLALTFTFSCSGDDGDEGGGGNTRGGCPNAVTGNNTVTCGGQTYRTTQIGEQVWMAENLNYNVSGSKCYAEDVSGVSADSIAKNCAKYGRLYSWATAMILPDSCDNNHCPSQISAKHSGICPSGWHLPSKDELKTLIAFAGGEDIAGAKLKATSGWNNYNGTDDYGFSALPGGGDMDSYGEVASYGRIGGGWWSSHESSNGTANAEWLHIDGSSYAGRSTDRKVLLRSIRCVKN